MNPCNTCGWEGEPANGLCRNCGEPYAPYPVGGPGEGPADLPEDFDPVAAELAIEAVLRAGGESPSRPSETAHGAIQALLFLTSGNDVDPASIFAPEPLPEPPLAGSATLSASVPIRAACDRCALPMFGEVRLRCRPGSKMLDGGHLARLTKCLAGRLQNEPQLAEQLAAALVDLGGAETASVRVSVRRPCDDCGAGMVVSTARARRAAPAGGDPPMYQGGG